MSADGEARSSPIRRRRSSRRSSRPPPTRSSVASRTSASSRARSTGQGHVWNATRKAEERIGNLLGLLGKEQVNLPKVGPGDIAAVAKLTSTHTGDTLVADRAQTIQLPPLVFPDADPAGQRSSRSRRPTSTSSGRRCIAELEEEPEHPHPPRGRHRRDDPDRHGRRRTWTSSWIG